MRHRSILWCALGLLAATGSPGSPRPPALLPGARSILWVGAHPDDESILAPLLGRLCLDEGLHCSLLVVTRGEGGHCLLANGCLPDLATVRRAEMLRAARLFGAALTLWRLPDGGAAADGTAGRWDEVTAGGHPALVARFAAFLAAAHPDVVVTFDPRHGSTCHADHRAVGRLVLESLARLQYAPSVLLLETRVTTTRDPLGLRFSSAAASSAGAFAFDANVRSFRDAGTDWQWVAADMRLHRSQFAADLVEAVLAAPAADRAVYLSPAGLALAPGAAVGACP